MRSTAVSVLAAAALVTGCLGPEQRTPPGSAPTVALNQEVHDGGVAFTVTRVEMSQPKVGYRTAQGTFIVVSMTVKNIGDGFRTVYCQNQTLTDLRGKTYVDAVPVGAGEDMMDIKPGKQVNVQCAFDVPVGTLAGAIEVHGQAYSTGASVKVLSVG
ncbi:MAG TPA: DUF4352 domain-containing protein [Mycobacterium sp.]|nr:DUF4352 domain-containing protein [Mycobacterium sp.]